MQELGVLQEDSAAGKEASVQSLSSSSQLPTQIVSNALRAFEVELAVIYQAGPRVNQLPDIVQVLGASVLARRVEAADIGVVG